MIQYFSNRDKNCVYQGTSRRTIYWFADFALICRLEDVPMVIRVQVGSMQISCSEILAIRRPVASALARVGVDWDCRRDFAAAANSGTVRAGVASFSSQLGNDRRSGNYGRNDDAPDQDRSQPQPAFSCAHHLLYLDPSQRIFLVPACLFSAGGSRCLIATFLMG